MGYFDSQFITEAGSALLAKATAGEGEIVFTAIHTGDGEYSTKEIGRITSCKTLKSERQIFPINEIDCREKDTRVRSVISNHELTEGYYIRETGLYARMEDEEEILFSVSVCVEKPTFLPAMGDVPIEMPVTNHITYSGDGKFTIEYRSDVYASLEMVKRISDKVEESAKELDIHINNNTIHFTASERTKLSGIATGANKYTHPASATGAKASGLYKIATDANGHVTGASALTKTDITNLGIPGTNTTYGTGTASVAGLTKLYTSTGTSTDGTMTRKAITDQLNKCASNTWRYIVANGTTALTLPSELLHSDEMVIHLQTNSSPPYCYSWTVIPGMLNADGIALVDGYKTGDYEGVAQVDISNTTAKVISCTVGNVDRINNCKLILYYRA